MADIKINFGSFQETKMEAIAVSAAAKKFFADSFGVGAVSVMIPKSVVPRFIEAVNNRNLKIN